jgi:hypothetical protein
LLHEEREVVGNHGKLSRNDLAGSEALFIDRNMHAL